MNELMRSVRQTPAPPGTAVLWWLGQMGLLIKMGDTVLCVDFYATPSADRLTAPPVPAREMSSVDAFLGTHDHLDHIDHEAWQCWARQCPQAVFAFPAPHLPAVLRDGVAAERCRPMKPGVTCRIGSATVRCIAAAHEFLNPDPETGLFPCLQYIIEGNGLRIWHAGDTLRYEGMLPALQAFGPLDAALLPINGRDGRRYRENCIGNMTFQEAADLAGELRPRLAIPGHWDMFAGNRGDPLAFADYLDAKYGGAVPCLVPEAAVPIRLRAV